MHQLGRVQRHQAQGVTDLVGEAGAAQANLVVTRVLLRAVEGQLAAGEQPGRKRVGAGVGGRGHGGRRGRDPAAVAGGHLLATDRRAGLDQVFRAWVGVLGLVVVADGGDGRFLLVVGWFEEARQRGVHPLLRGGVVVRVAILTRQEGFRAEGGQPLIQLPAAAAEILVISVAQREDGITQVFQTRKTVRLQLLEEPGGIVGRVPLPPGARDEEQVGLLD